MQDLSSLALMTWLRLSDMQHTLLMVVMETRTQASDFPFCQDCGDRIDERVRKYSVEKFGVALCRDCQKKRR